MKIIVDLDIKVCGGNLKLEIEVQTMEEAIVKIKMAREAINNILTRYPKSISDEFIR